MIFRELFEAQAADDTGNPFGDSHIQACIGPMSNAAPAVWGWDLAKHQDWTVGIALDNAGQVCRLIRFQDNWRATRRRILVETDGLPALVDSTGVGDPVLEELQHEGGDSYTGYYFSPRARQQLLDALALGIQNHYIRFPEGVIVSELQSFEYVYTARTIRYAAPEGLNDDAVMSLALAWYHAGHHDTLPYQCFLNPTEVLSHE
jgi:hypothetical protein